MWKRTRILAAVDLDVGTEVVLETALALAAQPGGELLVLHVFGTSPEGVDKASGATLEGSVKVLRDRTNFSREQFRKANPMLVQPSVERTVAVGSAVDEILWFAAHYNVDSIVVGAHHRAGVDGLLHASVGARVAREAGCAVVVTREKHHDPAICVPDIEPLCEACAAERMRSGGDHLWCAKHAEHHLRAHTYSAGNSVDTPHASEAASGI